MSISEKQNPNLNGKTLKGTYQSHKDGFGFFIPDNKEYKDFYVHANNTEGAFDRDIVEAKIKLYGGKYEAVITKIISRQIKESVGYIKYIQKKALFVPFSRNIQDWFTIKNSKGLKEYDVCKVKIAEYPALFKKGIVQIVEHLGTLADRDIDNKIVIEKYQLDKTFPNNCEEECNYIESSLFKTNTDNITDFRDLYTVTIDGETAKDFDDAISVNIKNDNELVLYVHIADVSRYVTNGSKLDEEARRRGSSVYFPEFAIPMLPEVLSNGVCSLMPNVDRYTVTVKITFDKEGNKINSSFYRSIINSNRRLTYNHVNQVLSGITDDDIELKEFLSNAKIISDLLLNKRKVNGVVEFELPDPVFTFDNDGNVLDVKPAERGYSERLIECFMIAANETVAEYFHENKINGIYRVHNNPDINKLKDWYNIAISFNVELPPFKEDITSKEIAEYSIIASQSEHSDLLNSLLVRSMMRAEYTTENIGHFGLASEAYTHFTSPIRRYPDLLVHRVLLSSLKLGDDSVTLDDLSVMANECSILERKAQDAEHDINTFKKLEYLSSNQNTVFDGYVNRVTGKGIFVYIEKLMITGFVDINLFYLEECELFIEYIDRKYGSDIPKINIDKYLECKSLINNINAEYKVGDKVKLLVKKINIETLQADFVLYDENREHNLKIVDSSKKLKSNTSKKNNSKKRTASKTSEIKKLAKNSSIKKTKKTKSTKSTTKKKKSSKPSRKERKKSK